MRWRRRGSHVVRWRRPVSVLVETGVSPALAEKVAFLELTMTWLKRGNVIDSIDEP